MPQILLLEDDETIAFGIKTSLCNKGYFVHCCSTLAEAKRCLADSIHLVLLDLNLPDGSGYDFCNHVKGFNPKLPVIFLTVRDAEKDIVQGLDMGADDYIIKPFMLSVLHSRINAVLRRVENRSEDTGFYVCGDISIDTVGTKVYLDKTEIPLTAGEYRLLLVMMKNKNQTMTRIHLLELLWDADGNFVNDNTLTVTMKRLREKLKNTSAIQTLRGIGYRMEDEA